jgi:hypothetical protein
MLLRLWLLSIVILPPSMTPPLREIGAYYFEALSKSEVWINLEPQGLQPGPNPVKLNITVSFPGRKTDRVPDLVELRAESIGGAFPNQVRQPIFHLDFERGDELDLIDQAHSFQFVSSCSDCSLDTVVARVPFTVLGDLRSPRTVIEAMGFSMRLQPADAIALQKFIDILSQGVAIR